MRGELAFLNKQSGKYMVKISVVSDPSLKIRILTIHLHTACTHKSLESLLPTTTCRNQIPQNMDTRIFF